MTSPPSCPTEAKDLDGPEQLSSTRSAATLSGYLVFKFRAERFEQNTAPKWNNDADPVFLGTDDPDTLDLLALCTAISDRSHDTALLVSECQVFQPIIQGTTPLRGFLPIPIFTLPIDEFAAKHPHELRRIE
jgi:hypothetical protein